MKTLKNIVLGLGFAVLVAAPVFTLMTPSTSYAAVSKASDCERPILGIRPWFRGLAVVNNGKCTIASPGQQLDGGQTLDLTGFIWRIALNVTAIALAVVGYIAFFFILFGGFQFLTGGSNPGQIEKARKTILNAVIGLIISLSAVALVNLIFGVAKL